MKTTLTAKTARGAALSLLSGWLLSAAILFQAQAQKEPALPEGLQGSSSQSPATSEPALPPGLQGNTTDKNDSKSEEAPKSGAEPALPSGLGGETDNESTAEPTLPSGLDQDQGPSETRASKGSAAQKRDIRFERWLREHNIVGFWEARAGLRLGNDPYQKDASIAETRLQLENQQRWRQYRFNLTADFIYDPVVEDHGFDLRKGEGPIDLREASVSFTPVSFMDVRAGRQVLTWGTGDLLFLNDLFPKDWRAFFIGRDVDYLKAPSDAVNVSMFSDWANLELVYTPRFNADRYANGRRLSIFNPVLGRLSGRDNILNEERPNEWIDQDEWAARLYKNVKGYELALYGYDGYWKSPGGINPASGEAIFPRLSVYGASARGQVGRGIGSTEVAYYDSKEDRTGDDPFINNRQFRFLVGYEQDVPELARDFTVGVQYYLEHMLDHNSYRRSLPAGVPEREEDRHLLTLRLTKLLMNQNLELSLFTFYSPTDQDAYFRPRFNYKITDSWMTEIGGNIFTGSENHTMFGQFEENSNAYLALRYSF